MSVELAAYLAVACFVVLVGFQVGLAAGMPWGAAAWGGRNPGRLPPGLRVASAVSIAVYIVAALVVLDRAGRPLVDLPPDVALWGTWLIFGLLVIGVLVNLASSSRYERFGWAPFAALNALLVLIVALAP
ncbi:MAG TPA: hypothetical protein VH741_01635 [Candidatus Limnocylindrales bacterium]|jgi:hypothetical protein